MVYVSWCELSLSLHRHPSTSSRSSTDREGPHTLHNSFCPPPPTWLGLLFLGLWLFLGLRLWCLSEDDELLGDLVNALEQVLGDAAALVGGTHVRQVQGGLAVVGNPPGHAHTRADG